MSFASGTIQPAGAMRPPEVRARTAVALMCATFAVGMLLGLVAPRLSVPTWGSSTVLDGLLERLLDLDLEREPA